MVFLALNLAFWGGVGALTVDRRATDPDPVEETLAVAVAGFVGVVVALEVLGLLGQINRTTIACTCVAIGAAGAWRYRSFSRVQSGAPSGVPTARRSWLSALAYLVLCLAISASLAHLLAGLVSPVEPISDSPIYHLPFAFQWLKAGRLWLIPTPFGEEAATYFPANGDLWLTWLLATGGGPLVKVGQWPFLVLGGVALYAIARRIDPRSVVAMLPALLCVGLPSVLAQSNIANIDLIWSAFFLVAVHFLLAWLEGPESRARRSVQWFALSSGIVAGAKLIGAVFVLPLIVVAVVVVATRAHSFQRVLSLAWGLSLPSALWYARNVWLTGNPVYPMQLSAHGHVLADGWFDRSAMVATAYHLPAAEWRLLVDRLGLVSGRAGLALVVLGATTGCVRALDRTRGRVERAAFALCSVLALAQVTFYWFVLPYNTQERFLSAALGLALVPLAGLAADAPILHAGLLALAGWQFYGWIPTALPLSLSIAAAAALQWIPRARWLAAGMLIAAGGYLSVGPALLTFDEQPALRFYPRAGFAARLLPGWQTLERSVPSAGARIAYAGTNLPYYLLGVGQRNHVEYVNINDHPDWLPHDYHRERLRRGQAGLAATPWPQWSRSIADYDAWMANLRSHRIDFLFIARENLHGRLDPAPGTLPPFPIERTWADAHPESFVDLGPFEYPIDTVPWVRVYRLAAAR